LYDFSVSHQAVCPLLLLLIAAWNEDGVTHPSRTLDWKASPSAAPRLLSATTSLAGLVSEDQPSDRYRLG